MTSLKLENYGGAQIGSHVIKLLYETYNNTQ